MKRLFLFIGIIILLGCKKDRPNPNAAKVDVYLLTSFSTSLNSNTTPARMVIENPVISSTKIIKNDDIIAYDQRTSTFLLKTDITTVIKNFSNDKAFVVTVDDHPVYYGMFHPSAFSHLVIGLATIDPMIAEKGKLSIGYINIESSQEIKNLDKRNDTKILQALSASRRLK